MPKQKTFEEALSKLEETVQRLEEGNLPLAEAVALFEEGTRLARQCNDYLDSAELKVKQLTQMPGGELVERALQVDGELPHEEGGV